MNLEVPTLSVIGVLIYSVLLFFMLVTYVALRVYHAFFALMIVGIAYILIDGVSTMLSFRRLRENVEKAQDEDIDFTECPDYWTTDKGGDDTTVCHNSFGDMYLDGDTITNPLTGGDISGVSKTSLNLDSVNKMSFQDKCALAKEYSWTDAYNKCTK